MSWMFESASSNSANSRSAEIVDTATTITHTTDVGTASPRTRRRLSWLKERRVTLSRAVSIYSDHNPNIRAPFGGIQRADRPAVCQGDLPRKAEADTASALMGRVERQENVLAPFHGIPGPLSRTSMRQLPVGSRAKVKLMTGSGTSFVARIAFRSRLSST